MGQGAVRPCRTQGHPRVPTPNTSCSARSHYGHPKAKTEDVRGYDLPTELSNDSHRHQMISLQSTSEAHEHQTAEPQLFHLTFWDSFCTGRFFPMYTPHLPCWNLSPLFLIRCTIAIQNIPFLSLQRSVRNSCILNSTAFSRLSRPSCLTACNLVPELFSLLVHSSTLSPVGSPPTAQHPSLDSMSHSSRLSTRASWSQTSARCVFPSVCDTLRQVHLLWPTPDLFLQHISHVTVFLYPAVPVKIKNLPLFFASYLIAQFCHRCFVFRLSHILLRFGIIQKLNEGCCSQPNDWCKYQRGHIFYLKT